MGRRPATERLDRAMVVFWEKGYYDTSIDVLVSRTGLHRAAVYGEFGSKRRLFEATLWRYREKVLPALFAPLARPADYLVGSVLGLWTLARSPVPRTVLEHYTDGLVALLKRLGAEKVEIADELSKDQPGNLDRVARRRGGGRSVRQGAAGRVI